MAPGVMVIFVLGVLSWVVIIGGWWQHRQENKRRKANPDSYRLMPRIFRIWIHYPLTFLLVGLAYFSLLYLIVPNIGDGEVSDFMEVVLFGVALAMLASFLFLVVMAMHNAWMFNPFVVEMDKNGVRVRNRLTRNITKEVTWDKDYSHDIRIYVEVQLGVSGTIPVVNHQDIAINTIKQGDTKIDILVPGELRQAGYFWGLLIFDEKRRGSKGLPFGARCYRLYYGKECKNFDKWFREVRGLT